MDDVTPSLQLTESLSTTWASGPILLHEYEGALVSVDVEKDTLEVLIPREIYPKAGVVMAKMSADKQYILLAYDVQRAFHQVPTARYKAYKLNDDAVQIAGGKRLQLAKWGPQGSQLVYVYENNIYYLTSPDDEPQQITSDGEPAVVFNGLRKSYADMSLSGEWRGGVQFSPDGSRLLFARLDLTPVANASLMRYGRPGVLDHQYAQLVTFRYAKPGTAMATVSLKVAALPSEPGGSINTQRLLAPVDVVSEDHYLEWLAWVNDATVMACWMNRTANVRQDSIYILSSDLEEIPGEKGLKVEQKDGWLDVHPPVFQTGSQTTTYVTILWHPNAFNVSFPHVVKVTANSTKAITSGDVTVTHIYGWAANGTIYYQATEESSRQVFAVEEGGDPRCLSCDFTSPEDNPCGSATAYCNRDLEWCAITCNGPDPPYSSVIATAAPEDKKLTSSSRVLRKMLKGKLLPEQHTLWVPVEGMSAHVRLLLPPDLDPTGEKRPAIVCVDAFPGSQAVDNSFVVDLFSYLTTSRRYVVILIDGRGAGGRGDRTLFSVYRRLGTVDVDDQIAATRWLAANLPFIDRSRIGITGRGYGGYVAAMALARDADGVFKCAASVAPITSWIYADMSVSERFMGFPTPEDNEAGYNASDVTRLADRFAGKRFLLVHGAADDKVLEQHSMALAAALQEAGVLFEQQSYPDEDHGLKSLQGHAYRTIDDFFRRCFDRTSLLYEIIQELIS